MWLNQGLLGWMQNFKSSLRGALQLLDCLCSIVTSCVLKVYLNENLETLRLFLHQTAHTYTHTFKHTHTHEHIHTHSEQVIRCQNQRLKRYINLRLTSAWRCSNRHRCQVCGESAAPRIVTVQMMIKGAITALVILQIAVSWVKKKKKTST